MLPTNRATMSDARFLEEMLGILKSRKAIYDEDIERFQEIVVNVGFNELHQAMSDLCGTRGARH